MPELASVRAWGFIDFPRAYFSNKGFNHFLQFHFNVLSAMFLEVDAFHVPLEGKMSHDESHINPIETLFLIDKLIGMARSAFFLVLILLLLAPIPASAQDEPTPTPQPTATVTPAYMQDVPLPSGNILHVERTITYGDAALVIVGLGLLVTIIVALIVIIPKMWLGAK